MNKSIVSRTITRTVAKGLIVDVATRTVNEWEDVVPNTCDTCEKALAYVRKTVPAVVAIYEIAKNEKLVGMTESEFISLAYWHGNERTKATRYAITKAITTRYGKVLVVDKDRKVSEIEYLGADSEKSARKIAEADGKFFVQLLSVREDAQIFAVDPATFEEHARPMKDRFTLAK